MIRSALVLMILLAVTGSAVSCKRALPPSDFVNDSLKGPQLAQTNYRLLKQGVVGTSTGFTLLWVPMSRPTESEARRDMVMRLKQEGIDLKGRPISYANATRERGGVRFLGFVAPPGGNPTARIN